MITTAPVHYHLGQFPPTKIDWTRLIPLIGPANAGLARYDGLLSAIPNAQILLSPLTTREAVLSSKIEGTHVTIGEVLEIEAGGESDTLTQPKRDDAEEVLNYRFEALHPFKDGNGRLGRMLIPLFLYQCKLLNSPDFYMSGYLEAKREEYQERLRAVSRDGDWTGWCAFFLQGIREQAAENESKARAILSLYDRVKNQVADITHSQHSIRVVDFMFQAPIFSAPLFINHSEIPKPTASRILKVLKDAEILRSIQHGKGRRPGIYAFRELLNIAEGNDVF